MALEIVVLLALAVADATYTVTTIAGGTDCGDGRLATAAQFGSPEGLAFDRAGNLYVADSSDHRVRRITPAGVVSTVAGNGYPGFRGDGGPARQAQLNFPYGLAVDASGNLYVADLGNGRVRKIGADGVIRTVAGGGATLGEATEARAARLVQPRNLALDAAGNLYISDFGDNRVYRVTPGGLIFRVAGVGAAGSIGSAEWIEAAMAPLNGPAGLAVDRAGALYVADSGNHGVRRIQGGRISSVVVPSGTLGTPVGLTLDAAGTLYVADKSGARVLRLTPGPPLVVAGNGASGWGGDGGPAVSAMLSQPRELAFDAAGNLYVADTQAGAGGIRRIGPTGWISAFAGDRTFRPYGDGGPPLAAHFGDPSGVALDGAGNLYVADRLGQRVRIVAAGGIGSAASQLNGPAGLALDERGSLWIAEAAGSGVRRLIPGGRPDRVVGATGEQPGYYGDGGPAGLSRLNSPELAAADAFGNLYIADTGNHVVRKVTPDGRIWTVAGKGVPGYAGDGGPATAALLSAPAGLAVAPDGGLFIADTGNHAIRRLTPTGTILTVAGTGAAGFSGDGGPAAEARLHAPSRLARDAAGNLFVADSANHCIRRIGPDGAIATIAGSGVPGFSGDDGPALAAEFNRPWDIALDAAGSLYVADRGNQRIRKLSPDSAPVVQPAGVEVAAVLHAASLLAGPVAPGQLVSLFGTNLGPGAGLGAQLTGAGLLATELGGVQVLFNGRPAALLYVQYGQVNLQVPYGVAGQSSAEIELRRDGAVKARLIAPVAQAAPGLFTQSGGAGPVAAYNEDRTANSASNPAPRGTVITLYATGEGQTNPAGIDGAPASSPYPQPALAPTLTIGGLPATLLYAGSAPGYAGLMQINARIPESIPAGNAGVELSLGTARSQPGVFISVR